MLVKNFIVLLALISKGLYCRYTRSCEMKKVKYTFKNLITLQKSYIHSGCNNKQQHFDIP